MKKEFKEIERHFNAIECPDCGGLHQCRLHCINNKEIQITFVKGVLAEPCWRYKSMVHKAVEDLKKKYSIE